MMGGVDVNVDAVGDGRTESGVADGSVLLAFTEAVMTGSADDVDGARAALSAAVGAAGVVDASAVIMMFNVVDRIADATGIPVDDGAGHDERNQLGDSLGMGHLAPSERSVR